MGEPCVVRIGVNADQFEAEVPDLLEDTVQRCLITGGEEELSDASIGGDSETIERFREAKAGFPFERDLDDAVTHDRWLMIAVRWSARNRSSWSTA